MILNVTYIKIPSKVIDFVNLINDECSNELISQKFKIAEI